MSISGFGENSCSIQFHRKDRRQILRRDRLMSAWIEAWGERLRKRWQHVHPNRGDLLVVRRNFDASDMEGYCNTAAGPPSGRYVSLSICEPAAARDAARLLVSRALQCL